MTGSIHSRMLRFAFPMLTFALVFTMAPPARTDEPAKAESSKSPKVEPKKSGSPSDPVIFLSGADAKLIEQLPSQANVVLLSRERHQELLDELERLRKQAVLAPPVRVSYCSVTGRIAGQTAFLDVTLQLNNPNDKGIVHLGLRKAEPLQILLNKKVPLLTSTPQGLDLALFSSGEHVITLKLKVKVEAQSSTPEAEPREGFEIGLPMVAYTNLSGIEMPDGLTGIEVNDEAAELDKERRLSKAAKSNGSLKVTWLKRMARGDAKPTRTAVGAIDTYLDPTHLTTRAELVLTCQGKPTDVWQLQLPIAAKVELAGAEGERKGVTINTKRTTPQMSLVTIRRSAPSMDPLTVVATLRRKLQRGELPPMGPFNVLRATTQKGTLRFHGKDNQRVIFPSSQAGRSFRVDLVRREATDDEKSRFSDLVSVYDYVARGLAAQSSAASSPWIEPRLSTAGGKVDAHVTHQLRLSLGPKDRQEWNVSTQIDVVPDQEGVEHLEVILPAPWKLDEQSGPRPPELIRNHYVENGNVHLRLIRAQTERFTVHLQARFTDDASLAPGKTVRIALPRPHAERSWDAGGHKISLDVPETVSLSGAQPEQRDAELRERRTHQLVWLAARFPSAAEFRWQSYQRETQVDGVVDLEWHETHFLVRHEFIYQASDSFPDGVSIRLPPNVLRPRAPDGNGFKALSVTTHPESKERIVRMPPIVDAARQKAHVKLTYAFWLTDEQRVGAATVIPVPLARPAEATHGWIRARVWGPAGRKASSLLEDWQDRPPEAVPPNPDLPLWVGEAVSPFASLTLKWQALDARSPVSVERALYQVRIEQDGLQEHQVRFRLTTDGRSPIVLEIPGAPGALRLQVFLDGRELKDYETLKAGSQGTRVHIPPIPFLSERYHEIMVRCRMSSPRAGQDGSFQSTIVPIRALNNQAPYPVRWQVDLPTGRFPVAWSGSERSAWHWTLRGFLMTPTPTDNAASLERWIRGESSAGAADATTPGLVSASSRLAPLTITHVPEQSWLMACSLVILVLGLGLYFVPIGRSEGASLNRFFWPLIALICLVGALFGMARPRLTAAVLHGCQPGAVVLAGTLVAYRLWHGRRHGRMMMMPGFRTGQRASTGSGRKPGERGNVSTSSHVPVSSVRRQGAASKLREPSTVDPPGFSEPPPESLPEGDGQ